MQQVAATAETSVRRVPRSSRVCHMLQFSNIKNRRRNKKKLESLSLFAR